MLSPIRILSLFFSSPVYREAYFGNIHKDKLLWFSYIYILVLRLGS